MKAKNAGEVKKFQDIPNVGPKMAEDFLQLGLTGPDALVNADGFTLYKKLCTLNGVRHDPCVLDTYLAVVDFMNGAEAKPWWLYTKYRKSVYPDV